MTRSGIITHYYNSKNYGGILQAYAMVKALSKLDYEAEQLCFDFTVSSKTVDPKVTPSVMLIKKYISSLVKKNIKNRIQSREKKFKNFELKIPHSKEIYRSDNICKCTSNYDVFITGSDQVWNMDWYYKEYFLDFVPNNKRKIAYAASMPNTILSNEQKKVVCDHLKSFDDISVREKDTAVFLEEITGRKVEWVLDPTLLLTKNDWDEICTERVVKEKYIFCYFLGTDMEYRKNAANFAKKLGYKIVTVPHLSRVNKNDIMFGNIRFYDVSPEQFISLIKHAEYVITDSFHATVFSNIYQTKYFVFDRIGIGKMSSRIKSLVSLTDEDFRFCTRERQSVEYMIDQKGIEVSPMSRKMLEMKEKSIEFLKRNLA